MWEFQKIFLMLHMTIIIFNQKVLSTLNTFRFSKYSPKDCLMILREHIVSYGIYLGSTSNVIDEL